MSPLETGSALLALSNELAGAVERASRSVVAIGARRRIPSSGIVWRDGVIVAANHTIRRDEDITLSLPDGSRVEGTLAGRDAGTDLAVLRFTGAKGATEVAATTADASALQVGRIVLAVGRPGASVTASHGIISAVGGEFRTWQGGRIDRLVRLDVAIYDGFSGGALVDAAGRVLGVNTSGLARAAALSVPVSTVDKVVDQLLASGRISRGYLGLGMQPVRLPEAQVTKHKLSGDVGLLVVNVDPGSPADRDGLLLGDILVSLGDTRVADLSDVLGLIGADSVGKVLEARVIRGGELATSQLTIAERKPRGR